MEDYKVRIKDLRKINGYNQTQIAAYLHVCQRTYSDYETGVIRIPEIVLFGWQNIITSTWITYAASPTRSCASQRNNNPLSFVPYPNPPPFSIIVLLLWRKETFLWIIK